MERTKINNNKKNIYLCGNEWKENHDLWIYFVAIIVS